MKKIVTNNPLKLSDKFYGFEFKDINVVFSLNTLIANAKLSNDCNDIYINITPLFASKECRFDSFEKWYRSEDTKRYINAKNNKFLINPHVGQLKNIEKTHKRSTWFNKEWLDQPTPLIISKAGRYGGTWLHYQMAVKFFASLSVDIEIEIYDIMTNLIGDIKVMTISRQNTKVLFHPLTDAIKDIYIPAQKSKFNINSAYPTLINLVNKKALGLTSIEYKEKYEITEEQIKLDGKVSIRDYMTKSELNAIETVEKDLWAIIKYVSTDYKEIKERLEA